MRIETPVGRATKAEGKSLGELPRYVVRNVEELSAIREGVYALEDGPLTYDLVYSAGRERRLFVLLSGAVDRAKMQPPVFQRWSWAKYFPGHCLCIADPTLRLSPELSLAWYVGTEQVDATAKVADLIGAVARGIGVPMSEVVTYGSSGGGFAALRLAALLEQVTAVVINPQTDITRYYRGHVSRFLAACFDGLSVQTAVDRHGARLSVMQHLPALSERRIIYAQNTLDEYHVRNHLTPFAEGLGLGLAHGARARDVELLLFENAGGHGQAESPELFPELMRRALRQ
jgi:hypothetical protein